MYLSLLTSVFILQVRWIPLPTAKKEGQPLHTHKKKFNNKYDYEDGAKAPTSPLLCCMISSLLAYGQMGQKGEVWPPKLADVNIQTKHMAALAATKHLADSLFPPTSFSCLM